MWLGWMEWAGWNQRKLMEVGGKIKIKEGVQMLWWQLGKKGVVRNGAFSLKLGGLNYSLGGWNGMNYERNQNFNELWKESKF